MAIFQPSNIIPSTFAGEGLGVVDASNNVNISWQVNGNSPMTAFQIKIYDNSQPENLTPIKDTGIITDGIPEGGFYGVDYKGNVQRFVYEPVNTATSTKYTWEDWGLSNGNEYKMVITQWWGNNPTAESETQVTLWSGSIFTTEPEPSIIFADNESTTFITVGTYLVNSQISSGNHAIDILSINGEDVFERYFTLTDTISSGKIFMVDKTNGSFIIYSYTDTNGNTGYKKVSLSSTNNGGTNFLNSLIAKGNIAYSDKPLNTVAPYVIENINPINWVEWNVYSYDSTTRERSSELIYSTGKINTQYLQFDANFFQQNNFYYIECVIQRADGVEGKGSFSIFVYYDTFDFDEDISFCKSENDGSFAISINNLNTATFRKLAIYESYATYQTLLYQGALNSSSEQIKVYSLTSRASHSINIYGIDANNRYSSAKTITCNQLQYNSYFLYETTQSEEYPTIFNVIKTWRFGNNISAGSISNNNSPNWLTNFTPYRLKQPSSRTGKSGTLQALLSNYNSSANFYNDTAEIMDKLYQASQSNNTFFLKDMKGNLYMVGISAPIVQTINTKSNVQEVKVSIPWEEVGDAKNVSLIKLPTDIAWNKGLENEVW